MQESRALSVVRTHAGHGSRVFNVAWHPHVWGMLASGSDDATVRVWYAMGEGGKIGRMKIRRGGMRGGIIDEQIVGGGAGRIGDWMDMLRSMRFGVPKDRFSIPIHSSIYRSSPPGARAVRRWSCADTLTTCGVWRGHRDLAGCSSPGHGTGPSASGTRATALA